jgi:hypothetical protein
LRRLASSRLRPCGTRINAVGIGEPDCADAVLAISAMHPRERHDGLHRRKNRERILAVAEKSGVLGRRSNTLGRRVARLPKRILGQLSCSLAALVVAEQRECG